MIEKSPAEVRAELEKRITEAEDNLALAQKIVREMPNNLRGPQHERSARAKVDNLKKQLVDHKRDHPGL